MSRQTCDRVRDDLVAFLDHELDSLRTSEVESHLLECAECRALAAEHREVWKLLDQCDPIAVPPGFLARVLARVGVRRPSTGAPRLRIGGLWVAAAAALLCVLVPLGVDLARPGDRIDLSPDEIEAALNIEILQDLEVLRTMDLVDQDQDPEVMKAVLELGEEGF